MGKFKFENEELRERFNEVFTFCEINGIEFNIDSIDFNSYRLADDFNLYEYLNSDTFEDDILFTEDDIVRVLLHKCNEDFEIHFSYFYDSIKEVKVGKLFENHYFISPQSLIVHVECDNILLNKLDEEVYSINQQWNDTEIQASIVTGLTSFGIKLVLDGNYDKYYPPVISEDTFIDIRTKDPIAPNVFDDILQSYLFELKSSLSLYIKKVPRITYLHDFDDEDEMDNLKPINIRPLMNGKGLSAVLKIYNSCHQVEDSEYRILNYTKIIEYVSQSVIRKEMLESVTKKLYSPRVLQPDASYILELEQLFNEIKNNKKDHQSIRLTVETCCDLSELISVAPKYLKKISCLDSKNISSAIRNSCFDELSNAISDTRNMLAHAKTTYQLKGRECPQDQLEDFANFLDVVAIQVIRWFSRQHEDSRII